MSVDRSQIERAIGNLITNAMKATPAGGKGRVPLNGYFFSAASLSSKPNPGFSGNGYRPFTMRMAGNPSRSCHTLSLSPD